MFVMEFDYIATEEGSTVPSGSSGDSMICYGATPGIKDVIVALW